MDDVGYFDGGIGNPEADGSRLSRRNPRRSLVRRDRRATAVVLGHVAARQRLRFQLLQTLLGTKTIISLALVEQTLSRQAVNSGLRALALPVRPVIATDIR